MLIASLSLYVLRSTHANITDVKVACECIEEYDVQGSLIKDLFIAAVEDDSSVSATVPVQELNVSHTAYLIYTRSTLNALHRCYLYLWQHHTAYIDGDSDRYCIANSAATNYAILHTTSRHCSSTMMYMVMLC
jgi:hypothetical protein